MTEFLSVRDNRFPYAVIFAGFGGQGVLLIGNLLAYAAMAEGKWVSYLPLYGVEMRGGTADCTIVISDQSVGSPVVEKADAVIIMNAASLPKYEKRLKAHGLLMVNGSLIDPRAVTRQDVHLHAIPFNDIANEIGNAKLANMVALGAFVKKVSLVRMESVIESFEKVLDKRHHPLIPANVNGLRKGAAVV